MYTLMDKLRGPKVQRPKKYDREPNYYYIIQMLGTQIHGPNCFPQTICYQH